MRETQEQPLGLKPQAVLIRSQTLMGTGKSDTPSFTVMLNPLPPPPEVDVLTVWSPEGSNEKWDPVGGLRIICGYCFQVGIRTFLEQFLGHSHGMITIKL